MDLWTKEGEMALKSIMVDDVEYKVIDHLGYEGGLYGKEVETPEGPRIVSSRGARGPWAFHRTLIRPGGSAVGQ